MNMSEPAIGAENTSEAPSDQGNRNKMDVDTPVSEGDGATDGVKEAGMEEGTSKNVQQDDAYNYTQEGQLFTSEIYKIEIQNLPKHFGFKQLKKMITNLNLKPKKVKAVNRATYAFVTFTCEEDREEALKVLNGHKWKNQVLRAKLAKPKADPLIAKRKQDSDNDGNQAAKRSKQDILTPEERLCNAVIPYWNKSYEEQLKLKEESMEQFMITLGKTFERQTPELKPWLITQRLKNDNLCCELQSVIPSPAINEYRNKCEFSIGRSSENHDNTVGFRFGRYKGGTVDVLEPTCCCNVPSNMKKVAAAFQKHIRSTGLPSHQPQTHKGYWHMLVVRMTLDNQIMAIAHLHQQKLSEEEISKQKKSLRDYFVEGEGKSCLLTSLYIQLQKDRERQPLEHLWGEKCIHESMMGLKFRISPEAFFQVNTKAAEILYKTIADWCGATKKSTVLDVCCGTGTIGISIAKNVHRVIGVEMNEQATHDAKENAKLNGIDNIEFHCGKAEDVMPSLTSTLENCKDIIAIVDPPRAGLHKKVIESIRRCAYLEKLVYVSCNPNIAIGNFVDLCRRISIKSKGVPFRLVKAVPVDLFPHTPHCELLMLFERTLCNAKDDQASEDNVKEENVETSEMADDDDDVGTDKTVEESDAIS
ncbi:tRNA (uracil-5-)-methyltransferase homolog A-like [Antedon mediterranea]|uniref:tRNA (uracil-5-)-methyltransferase homolog A-like n=1 Tax=Antedon mediterranea TaxID=105859 RepID=UPI003AF70F40